MHSDMLYTIVAFWNIWKSKNDLAARLVYESFIMCLTLDQKNLSIYWSNFYNEDELMQDLQLGHLQPAKDVWEKTFKFSPSISFVSGRNMDPSNFLTWLVNWFSHFKCMYKTHHLRCMKDCADLLLATTDSNLQWCRTYLPCLTAKEEMRNLCRDRSEKMSSDWIKLFRQCHKRSSNISFWICLIKWEHKHPWTACFMLFQFLNAQTFELFKRKC